MLNQSKGRTQEIERPGIQDALDPTQEMRDRNSQDNVDKKIQEDDWASSTTTGAGWRAQVEVSTGEKTELWREESEKERREKLEIGI